MQRCHRNLASRTHVPDRGVVCGWRASCPGARARQSPPVAPSITAITKPQRSARYASDKRYPPMCIHAAAVVAVRILTVLFWRHPTARAYRFTPAEFRSIAMQPAWKSRPGCLAGTAGIAPMRAFERALRTPSRGATSPRNKRLETALTRPSKCNNVQAFHANSPASQWLAAQPRQRIAA